MTNLEFYKEEIEKRYHYINTQSNGIFIENLIMAIDDVYQKFGLSSMSILDWLCEEYQILDKEEKEYLSAVIRPFRKRVISLTKSSGIEIKYEKLELVVELPNKSSKTCVRLPYFKKDTMYKGMELDKQYTLEELGL